jgi:outer membrane receptor protein involved in Fe transport
LFTSTSNTGSAIVIVPSINLRPEHSWTYEIGSAHHLSGNLRVNASLFHSDFHNLIEPNVFLDLTDSLPKVNFRNITEARIQGFEAGLTAATIDQSFRFDINYNYNWAVERTTGSFLLFRPRHIGTLSATYDAAPFIVGADFRYISRIEKIDDKLIDLAPIVNGKERVPIYVLDVRLLAALSDYGLPFRASVNVNNLLGYQYVELVGNVAPPRHIVFALEGVIR